MTKHDISVLLITMASSIAAVAGPTSLALRLESTCIYNGSTCKTIETAFGTNLSTLPFSGTTTYDFYSPALKTTTSLTTSDIASGSLYMANTGSWSTNDFTVTGRMTFFDYDPRTGNETALANTGDSTGQVIKHGDKAIGWPLPKVNLPANATVPAGHSLHVAVTVTLVSGNAAGLGQFLYNGPQTSSSSTLLPQNRVVSWDFAPPSTRVCLAAMPDGCQHLTCAATPNQTYSVQATTNLAAPVWVNIGSATADANGSFSFVDADAPNFSWRFYRLAQ